MLVSVERKEGAGGGGGVEGWVEGRGGGGLLPCVREQLHMAPFMM